MDKSLKDALKDRHSFYAITGKSPVSDEEIEKIIDWAVTYVPSAFNSQSTRIVLLLGEQHKKLWNIVKDTLRKIVSPDAFKATETKIDTSFASGYGTVLFFEDESVVKKLQDAFPTYKEKFPVWSQHTSAMHQIVIWMMLEDAGFGASLQHYNPLIDAEVRRVWSLPESWSLVAQMPFGLPLEVPQAKEKEPLSEKIRIFK